MAMMAVRLRSALPLLNNALRSNSFGIRKPIVLRALLCPTFTSSSEFSRSYATPSEPKEEKKITLPLTLHGGAGNYASALYLSAVRADVLERVESELLGFVEASKRSSKFTQFAKDETIPKKTRVVAIEDICAETKFSQIMKNFLVIVAENGRLKYLEEIANSFLQLMGAHRGEMTAIVTTVTPLPPDQEEDVIAAVKEMVGEEKKIKLEKKIDPRILGGLVVEFDNKVVDISVKSRLKKMQQALLKPINWASLKKA